MSWASARTEALVKKAEPVSRGWVLVNGSALLTNASVRALAHDAGALVIGGTFATVNGTARTNLAVVSATANGQLGPGAPVDGLVEALMVDPPARCTSAAGSRMCSVRRGRGWPAPR